MFSLRLAVVAIVSGILLAIFSSFVSEEAVVLFLALFG